MSSKKTGDGRAASPEQAMLEELTRPTRTPIAHPHVRMLDVPGGQVALAPTGRDSARFRSRGTLSFEARAVHVEGRLSRDGDGWRIDEMRAVTPHARTLAAEAGHEGKLAFERSLREWLSEGLKPHEGVFLAAEIERVKERRAEAVERVSAVEREIERRFVKLKELKEKIGPELAEMDADEAALRRKIEALDVNASEPTPRPAPR